MPDYIGNIAVPAAPTPTAVFPIKPSYGSTMVSDPLVYIHQFGSGQVKIEQRFYAGSSARRWTVSRSALRLGDMQALKTFWEARGGAYEPFFFDAPNEDGTVTRVTVRFENEPLSWDYLSNSVVSVGVTLIEVPTSAPTYSVASTDQRSPSSTLKAGLLPQAQEIIPLVQIQPREAGYPAIYLSDRRCTVGGQLYLARLVKPENIGQSMGNAADEAKFVFGNADRVMRDLANDTNLWRASISYSLFHVATGIRHNLWSGEITNWDLDAGPEFSVSASDGLYELSLPYPNRRISRVCWKDLNSTACPFSSVGVMDSGTFPMVSPTSCDKGYGTANGCRAHGMNRYFGGVIATPQGVRIMDNSTGHWGFGRSPITATSQVQDSVYDQVIPEVYTDDRMPVNCKITAGRDESDFFTALGIVSAGPLGAYYTTQKVTQSDGSERLVGHMLDGQPHHGYGTSNPDYGLRTSLGSDPAGTSDQFAISSQDAWPDDVPFAAGTAFIEVRRADVKGLQLQRIAEHQMQAIVLSGMSGWQWSGPGSRTWARVVNPVWIAINMILRARGLQSASASTAEQYFDVGAACAAAAICDDVVARVGGSGTETQFKFRGTIQEEKPLKDWVQEVLMNCLGYFTSANGKVKIGLRVNSSAVEAFTAGNIIHDSLKMAPIRPEFNHLTSNFADEEFEFVNNSMTIYDVNHAKLIGGATSPLFLKNQLNLSGTSSKSQAARIISVRLREELGGINEDEWAAARMISFRTTILALNVEPGMVCSMTHEDMPGGYGEFRVTGWRLNEDFTIDIQGRTTTDSMYDLAIGPKPADVVADPLPGDVAIDLQPPNVVPIDTDDFLIGTITNDGVTVFVPVEYDPPPTPSTFTGVAAFYEFADKPGQIFTADLLEYNGDINATDETRHGTGTVRISMPADASQECTLYLAPRSIIFSAGVPVKSTTPKRTFTIPQAEIGGGLKSPMNYGAAGDGTTDDTAAVLACATVNDVWQVPADKIFLTDPLTITGRYGLAIRGNGTLKKRTEGAGDSLLTFSGCGDLEIGDVTLNSNGADYDVTIDNSNVYFNSVKFIFGLKPLHLINGGDYFAYSCVGLSDKRVLMAEPPQPASVVCTRRYIDAQFWDLDWTWTLPSDTLSANSSERAIDYYTDEALTVVDALDMRTNGEFTLTPLTAHDGPFVRVDEDRWAVPKIRLLNYEGTPGPWKLGAAFKLDASTGATSGNLLPTPLDYGAVGDGVTDDTEAVTQCMEGNLVWEVPGGYTFLIDPITIATRNGIDISGAGKLKRRAAASGTALLTFNTLGDARVSGITIDANGLAFCCTIAHSTIYFDSVIFTGHATSAINLSTEGAYKAYSCIGLPDRRVGIDPPGSPGAVTLSTSFPDSATWAPTVNWDLGTPGTGTTSEIYLQYYTVADTDPEHLDNGPVGTWISDKTSVEVRVSKDGPYDLDISRRIWVRAGVRYRNYEGTPGDFAWSNLAELQQGLPTDGGAGDVTIDASFQVLTWYGSTLKVRLRYAPSYPSSPSTDTPTKGALIYTEFGDGVKVSSSQDVPYDHARRDRMPPDNLMEFEVAVAKEDILLLTPDGGGLRYVHIHACGYETTKRVFYLPHNGGQSPSAVKTISITQASLDGSLPVGMPAAPNGATLNITVDNASSFQGFIPTATWTPAVTLAGTDRYEIQFAVGSTSGFTPSVWLDTIPISGGGTATYTAGLMPKYEEPKYIKFRIRAGNALGQWSAWIVMSAPGVLILGIGIYSAPGAPIIDFSPSLEVFSGSRDGRLYGFICYWKDPADISATADFEIDIKFWEDSPGTIVASEWSPIGDAKTGLAVLGISSKRFGGDWDRQPVSYFAEYRIRGRNAARTQYSSYAYSGSNDAFGRRGGLVEVTPNPNPPSPTGLTLTIDLTVLNGAPQYRFTGVLAANSSLGTTKRYGWEHAVFSDSNATEGGATQLTPWHEWDSGPTTVLTKSSPWYDKPPGVYYGRIRCVPYNEDDSAGTPRYSNILQIAKTTGLDMTGTNTSTWGGGIGFDYSGRPTSATSKVIQDGNFELGGVGLDVIGNAAVVAGAGVDGSKGLRLTGNGQWNRASQYVGIFPSRTYQFSIVARVNANANPTFYLNWCYANGTVISSSEVKTLSGSSFTQYQITAKSHKDASRVELVFCLLPPSATIGTVDVDLVDWKDLTEPGAGTTYDANGNLASTLTGLISNGDFEYWDDASNIKDWTCQGVTRYTSARSGLYSAALISSGAGSTQFIKRIVSAQPGQTFRLDVMAVQGSPGTFKSRIVWLNEAGSSVGTPVEKAVPVVFDWAPVSVVGTAPAGTTKAEIYAGYGTGNASGNAAWFDGVSLSSDVTTTGVLGRDSAGAIKLNFDPAYLLVDTSSGTPTLLPRALELFAAAVAPGLFELVSSKYAIKADAVFANVLAATIALITQTLQVGGGSAKITLSAGGIVTINSNGATLTISSAGISMIIGSQGFMLGPSGISLSGGMSASGNVDIGGWLSIAGTGNVKTAIDGLNSGLNSTISNLNYTNSVVANILLRLNNAGIP